MKRETQSVSCISSCCRVNHSLLDAKSRLRAMQAEKEERDQQLKEKEQRQKELEAQLASAQAQLAAQILN